MPYLIAFAVSLHIAVLAPLYLVFSNGGQLEIKSLALLGWPLLGAAIAAILLGGLLKLTVSRGFIRPLAASAAFAVYLYLQFYGFVWDFGLFDGRIIDFGSYGPQAILEGVVFVGLMGFALSRPRNAVQVLGRFLVIVLLSS